MDPIDEELDEALLHIAEIKARKLVGNFGLRWQDVEDIISELYLEWLEHSRRFRPERSSRRTFQNRVLDNAIVDMVRKRQARNRGYGILFVPVDHLDYERSGINDVEFDSRDQGLDILKLVHRLPPELKPIALTLMQADSTTQTAHRLGISRPALYRDMDRIRDCFEQAGFLRSSRRATKQGKKRPSRNQRPLKRTPK